MDNFWEQVEAGFWDEEPVTNTSQEPEGEEAEQMYAEEDEGYEIAQQDFEEEPEEEEYSDFSGADNDGSLQTAVSFSPSSGNFTEDIVAKESGGNYKAVNPHSSAAGKYQFLWKTWGPKIRSFTGVGTKEDFLNNPEAQDRFYNEYYLPNELLPAVQRLKKQGASLPDDQLAKLVHFRGEAGAAAYLAGQVGDKPESYNSSISSYINQYGGKFDMNGNEVSVKPGMEELYADEQFGRKPLKLNQTSYPTPVNSNIEDDNQELYDFGIAEDLATLYDKGKSFLQNQVGNAAEAVSGTIDVANEMLSNQQNLQNYQKRLKILQDERYFPVNQKVNNIPIFT